SRARQPGARPDRHLAAACSGGWVGSHSHWLSATTTSSLASFAAVANKVAFRSAPDSSGGEKEGPLQPPNAAARAATCSSRAPTTPAPPAPQPPLPRRRRAHRG